MKLCFYEQRQMEDTLESSASHEQLRESAWELFRQSAELRTRADELAKRAAEFLKLAAEKEGRRAEPRAGLAL
jgi:hypothetical protein